MVYFQGAEKRPIRLSESTHAFAEESLKGKYGDEAKKTMAVSLDHLENFENESPARQCAVAMMEIALKAPIRICTQETVSGAATLAGAFLSGGPAVYKGKNVLPAVDHVTPDFLNAVRLGIDVYEKKIQQKRLDSGLTAYQLETLDTMQASIDALHIYHERYMEALRVQKPENAEILKNVPFLPPTNFKEAVQSLWFLFSFARLLGNWPGLGRIDTLLGPYLEKDLLCGAITVAEAREVLAGFFIKGCEWIESVPVRGSGDAQTYQNIVLGGLHRENGKICECTNTVTYLILEIVEELPIGDFPITVRLRKDSPKKLKELTARAIRCGGGTVAIYNEELIFSAMRKFGYPEEDYLNFANDGCWEVQVPGKTCFSYDPFDGLRVLLHDTLRLNTDAPAHFETFEELYAEYIRHLRAVVESIKHQTLRTRLTPDKKEFLHQPPCAFISLLTENCIERAKYYHEGGACYTVLSPHMGGVPDAGNSLYAIDQVVFKEKRMTFDQLMNALRQDWEGEEWMRNYVCNHYSYFGNDCDEADSYVARIIRDFGEMLLGNTNSEELILFPAGVSTFGRQIQWAQYRGAVPFGAKAGEILSGNLSPVPNTDTEGASAVIRSYCKCNLDMMTTGCALDLKMDPGTLKGEKGISVIIDMMDAFIQLGGYFMQMDFVDVQTLKNAQEHPENYKNLSVRVSGWNARFVSLDAQWQQMIIERTEQSGGE